jgi:hypothetical protein
MKYKHRLIVIVFLAATIFSSVIWLTFHPTALKSLFDNRLFVLIAVALCLASIFPLFLIARKSAPKSVGGPILMIGSAIFAFVVISAEFFFHATWVSAALHWGDLAILCAFGVVIWYRFFRRTNLNNHR